MPVEIRSFFLSLMATFVILSTGTSAFAELVPLLSLTPGAARAGRPLEFRIYFHNEAAEPTLAIIPRQVQVLLTGKDGSSRQLSAFSDSEETMTELPPNGFRKKTYILALPADLYGTLQYKIAGYPNCAGLLAIEAPQQLRTGGVTDSLMTPAPKPEVSRKSMATLYQTYAANFSAYQPTYFLFGTDPEKSKFQISFKYRLFNPGGSLSRRYPWIEGFHFGYTQTSFWDLDSDSAPFEDTSYKPELFYQTDNLPFRPSWMEGLSVQLGAQHESNGREEELSRSTNYFYVRPEFVFYHRPLQLGLVLSPRLFTYFNNNNSTNPDFADYRGHVELLAGFGRANSLTVLTSTRFAEEGTSFQADLSFPIHRLLRDNLDLYFHIQYSNALAESLIRYRDRVEAVRIGFSLVR